MTRNVSEFLTELTRLTPDERRIFKQENGLTDIFGFDVIEELIAILTDEQTSGTIDIDWTPPGA